MNIEQESEQQLTVGQMLNQARQARGLTLNQVGSQLNLAITVIEQLEQDKFKARLQETYVNGYIRAYAKLLKIPDKKLKAALVRDGGDQREVTKPMQTFSNRTKHQATDNKFIWLTYGIVIFFIVLLIVWWWQTEADFSQWSENVTSESAKPTVVEQAGLTNQENSAITIDNSVVIENLAEPTPVSSDTTETNLPPSQDNTKLDNTEAKEDNLALIAAETNADVVVTQDSLDMQFTDACWVNVIDAQGERVAYGTKEKGYIMTLKGKAPFVVTLGNPEAVIINFNDQPYDISALPKGRVAKFTIPGSE